MDIAKKAEELIKNEIIKSGYILDSVIYEKEGNTYFLRIVIDKQGYVTVDDCVTVTNIVNPILDEQNFINDSYILDISSKEKGSF